MVTAVKEKGEWTSRSHQLRHYPWRPRPVGREALQEAGFTQIMTYGGYDFSEFDLDKSKDLILVCELGRV